MSTPSASLSSAFPVQGIGTFGWNASVGYDGGTPVAVFSDHSVELQVPDDALAITFTIEWTCAVQQSCSLNVWVKRDGQPDSAALKGDGPLTVEIQAPEAGEWFVTAMSDGATAGVKGTVTWTISGPRQA